MRPLRALTTTSALDVAKRLIGERDSVLPRHWAMMNSDCLDWNTGMPSLPRQSVEVSISDPPYDDHTHNSQRRGATNYRERPSQRATFNRKRNLGFKAITPQVMYQSAYQLARLTRRWVLIFCTIEMVKDWKHAVEVAGLQYLRAMTWRKRGAPPSFTGDRPAQATEHIVVAHRPGRKYWNGGGKHGFFDHPIVLNRGSKKERLHTTQKPLALMERLVELFSDKGETVLDPFSGSATTGVACLNLGRQFIGYEKSARDAKIASNRLIEAEAELMAARAK